MKIILDTINTRCKLKIRDNYLRYAAMSTKQRQYEELRIECYEAREDLIIHSNLVQEMINDLTYDIE